MQLRKPDPIASSIQCGRHGGAPQGLSLVELWSSYGRDAQGESGLNVDWIGPHFVQAWDDELTSGSGIRVILGKQTKPTPGG